MSYSAVVLDGKSREKLLTKACSQCPILMGNWSHVAHHMTIEFPADSHPMEGKKVELEISELGFNLTAFAAKVSKEKGGSLSKNKIPHITIAVDRKNGGKPVDSNKITMWQKVQPLTLTGVVKVVR